MNELLIQDFRTVILNLDQFVPSQFVAIDLIRDGHVILTTGSRENSILNLDNEFKTIDQTSLVFSSSYQLINFLCQVFLSIFVLLISKAVSWLKLICLSCRYTLEECVQITYNDIKDRKGIMSNGVFIKESDPAYASIIASIESNCE